MDVINIMYPILPVEKILPVLLNGNIPKAKLTTADKKI